MVVEGLVHLGVLLFLFDLAPHQHHHRDEERGRDDNSDDRANPERGPSPERCESGVASR